MKKIRILIAVLCCILCGCGAQAEPEGTTSLYMGVIERLEAGDYDGARAQIDALEGLRETAEMETVPKQSTVTQPDSVIHADMEIVELTQDNVRYYFEFVEEFVIGEPSHCTQYITLKEEYRDRLLSVEDAFLNVTLLRCEAYGSIDLEEEEFRADYYDPISQKKEARTLELDYNGSGWITGMTVYSDSGCFPDYAMDVQIESGSGKLVFSAE